MNLTVQDETFGFESLALTRQSGNEDTWLSTNFTGSPITPTSNLGYSKLNPRSKKDAWVASSPLLLFPRVKCA